MAAAKYDMDLACDCGEPPDDGSREAFELDLSGGATWPVAAGDDYELFELDMRADWHEQQARHYRRMAGLRALAARVAGGEDQSCS